MSTKRTATAADAGQRTTGAAALAAWLGGPDGPTNADLGRRVVLPWRTARWRAARERALEYRALEYVPGATPRLAAQLRLAPGVGSARLDAARDVELFVQRGLLVAEHGRCPAGVYLRLPAADAGEPLGVPTLYADADGEALLYVAAGHIAPSDAERRRIDTNVPKLWLPGPVEGTEVLPLHGHGSANAMLIRWHGAVAFRPRLDPLGEELMVLEGCLHDADGDYPVGSWLRNPVPAWQSWSGEPGTLVHYKSGHFASLPDTDSLPFPTALAGDGRGESPEDGADGRSDSSGAG